MMFENKRILVTGGTGSFARTFIPKTIEKHNPAEVIVYSRDEMKQWELANKWKELGQVTYTIGDVRDVDRLVEALRGVDYVIHAAATKIVPTAEANPSECLKTNVLGAINVIQACKACSIKRVVALSTDKASNPVNLYGASKLASDKLFTASNLLRGVNETRFSVVRYGNVMGSRGSVIPYFYSMRETGILPITDERMTRFMITLDAAVDLVWTAFEDMGGGDLC